MMAIIKFLTFISVCSLVASLKIIYDIFVEFHATYPLFSTLGLFFAVVLIIFVVHVAIQQQRR